MIVPASMDPIPLLCKICPKQPHFSDISHLLTHVSSKGHLFHLKNAQLRSHQDIPFRKQLEAYDEWYDQNQIEKLLAQRMAQKDSKNTKGKPRQTRSNSSIKEEDPPQKSRRRGPSLQHRSAQPTTQDPIDPQLSLFLEPGDGLQLMGQSSPSPEPSPFDIASLRRSHAVRTRSRTPAVSQDQKFTEHANPFVAGALKIKSNMDEEGELEWPNLLSPIKTSYPDPSTLAGHFTFAPTPTPVLTPGQSRISTPSRFSTNGQSPLLGEANATHFLRLKGPQYPGMALFDSASPNSQRLRNQKKEHSLLAQMEHHAEMVEPLEQIYFPEWTLKKARLITGNVESSPIQETTPKPKRRRAKPGKTVLGELSTNIPTTKSFPRAAKPSSSGQNLQIVGLEDPFTQDTATLKGAHNCKSFQNHHEVVDEEAVEWRLNMGIPRFTALRGFTVFEDPKPSEPSQFRQTAENQPPSVDDPFLQCQYAQIPKNDYLEAATHEEMNAACTGPARPFPDGRKGPDRMVQQSLPNRGPVTSAFQKVDPQKENINPMLDPAGNIDDDIFHAESERITQRYFSVTGNDPPQFFNNLPPQMDFGGLTDHRFWGSPFNPLNPQAWQQQHGSYLPIFQHQNVLTAFQSRSDVSGGRSNVGSQSHDHQNSTLPRTGAKRTQSKK